ncbi:MAG TPA: GAF domain-containing protein [Gaiellaceae bacterium]|nr:GAF domain-containing protein [Gaiellaceae bacterium]
MGDHPEHEIEVLRRLQSLTDVALEHLDLDELLAALLVRVRDLVGSDTAAVLLLDEEHDDLVARAAVGLEEEVERGVRIPMGRGFAGRIAASRRPVVLDDVDHADVLNPILREKGVKSLLGVPLLVGERVLGVVHVGTLAPRDFDDADVRLLQLAAQRAALAIDHARLYEAERNARRRLEHLQAVTDVALAHLGVDELLAVLLPRIREILLADTCAVLLLDEETRELVARSAVGIEEAVEQGIRIPLGRGFAGRIAASGQPVILDDVDHSDVLNPILREKGIKSLLGVPLGTGATPIGVLHVGTLRHRRFTRSDTELLQLVGTRVAIAIERARLHEEIVELDKLKLNFVAVASHELRTPATSVYGTLATLVRHGRTLPPETWDDLLRVGLEQGERLRRLIEQLLDLSRLDAHAIALSPKAIDLRETLVAIAAQVAPPDGDVHVRARVAAVTADPLALDRIVSNLLVNAFRYGSPPVVVTADATEDAVHVVVEDGGGGVPPELVPRLFERFARGDDRSGSGLGLAIAQAYAEAHGGTLTYAPAGAGARFELVLPQPRGAGEGEAAPTSSSSTESASAA